MYSIIRQTGRIPVFNPLWQKFVLRTLFSDELTKITDFKIERDKFMKHVENLTAFWSSLETKIAENRLFDKDLKLACYLTDKEHLPLVSEMLHKYYTSSQIRLGKKFSFAPIFLRACKVLGDVDVPLQVFYSDSLRRVIQGKICMLLLLDILYDAAKYDDLINVYETMKALGWVDYPPARFMFIPYALVLYRNGTEQDYQKLEEYTTIYTLTTRSLAINAAFALKLKNPKKALSILTVSQYDDPLLLNLQIQAMAALKEDLNKITKVLKSQQKCVLYKDTFEILKTSFKDELTNYEGFHKLNKMVDEEQTTEKALYSEVREFFPLTEPRLYQIKEDNTLVTLFKKNEKKLKLN